MAKTTHTATGTSEEVTSKFGAAYYADFSSGTGSAQLQVKLNGTWLPADNAVTATMTTVEATEKLVGSSALSYRWNVTVSSGSIVTYIE